MSKYKDYKANFILFLKIIWMLDVKSTITLIDI